MCVSQNFTWLYNQNITKIESKPQYLYVGILVHYYSFKQTNARKSRELLCYQWYLKDLTDYDGDITQCARSWYQKDICEKFSDSLLNVEALFLGKTLLHLVV